MINMADQYTRVVAAAAGSTAASTTGLLFGTYAKQTANSKSVPLLAIVDAEDLPLQAASAAVAVQKELHQAVFPHHEVVGWYRVVGSDQEEPTPHDLSKTLHLQQEHSKDRPFLLAMLVVSNDDDELPLTLYQVVAAPNPCLIVSDWQLATSSTEQIAVERVMRAVEENAAAVPPPADRGWVQTCQQTLTCPVAHLAPTTATATKDDVLVSMQAMQQRLAVIQSHLQQDATPSPALLRKIRSLFLHWGYVASLWTASTNDVPPADNPTLTSQLLLLSQAMEALMAWSTKIRLVQQQSDQPDHNRRRRDFPPRGSWRGGGPPHFF
jgi:hypothetical protein